MGHPLHSFRRTFLFLVIFILPVLWLVPSHGPALAAHPVASTDAQSPSAPAQSAGVQACAQVNDVSSTQSDCSLTLTTRSLQVPIGVTSNLVFNCGSAIAELHGAAGSPYPKPGCYNVQASLLDLTGGSSAPFSSALCQGQAVPASQSVDCAPVTNPLCPELSVVCAPCPTNFTNVGGVCQGPPNGNNACPPGYTANANAGGGVVSCFGPPGPAPAASGELSLSFEPTAPHAFLVVVTGYVPPLSDGLCPQGTTLTPPTVFTVMSGNLPGPTFTAPACAFTVQIAQRGVELTRLVVQPPASCIGPVDASKYSAIVGQACLAGIQALGIVVIKEGVNCDNGSEPATGTTPRDFPVGSTYECSSGTLRVVNIPLGGVPVTLTATNGILNPTCFPLYAAPQPTATPTVTDVVSPIATARPTATPTPDLTGTPGPSSSPTPRPSGSAAAFCAPPGQSTVTLFTGSNGQVNYFGNQVEFSAYTDPFNPAVGFPFDVVGEFAVDQAPLAGVPMYAHYNDVMGNSEICGPVDTDPNGISRCRLSSDSQPAGQTTFVDVDFILNCTDFMTSTSFTPNAPPEPAPTAPPVITASAPNGICVLRTADGPVSVRAVYLPPIDSQPPIDTGNVVVGQFNHATSTPTITPVTTPAAVATPTNTPTPTPTNTPTPTPTNTPTPTPTPSPTAPPTPTVTPTALSVAVPSATAAVPTVKPLSFSLDAARVDREKHVGDRQGINEVKPGQHVNLLLYFTVRSLPRSLARVTTYEIDEGSRVVFKAEYRTKQGAKELGGFVRYIPYLVPPNFPPDLYTFRATLRLDSHQQTRTWTFAVVGAGSVAPR